MKPVDRDKVSEWYLETLKKADVFEYGPVKGTMVLKPYGFEMWKAIQKYLSVELEALGCRDAYFPSLIPMSFITREKEHVKGFAPELAVITKAGGKELDEPVVVRPTSETIIYHFFRKWISSWRDLPLKVNQWVNVVRWELRTFPFLRGTEFLWHEAHTAHATEEDADRTVMDAIEAYKRFFEDVLAIPVVIGKKTEREKFAGALYSTSCEALLMDLKGLQIGTAHNMGTNFSKSFDIKYQTEDKGRQEFAWTASWGLSTRALGGMILTHGDSGGLVLPPRIAPIQVIIVPIWKSDDERKDVLTKANNIEQMLKDASVRVETDLREETPGWKFYDAELRGIPLRLELGPRDIKSKQAVLARRDTKGKTPVPLDALTARVQELLDEIQAGLLEKARKFVSENTHRADTFEEFAKIVMDRGGFIRAHWCGSEQCEAAIKEKTSATTRCIPFEDGHSKGRCVHCGADADVLPLWAKAY